MIFTKKQCSIPLLAGLVLSAGVYSPASAQTATTQAPPASRIKLIEAGWERPNSSDLLEHLKIIEKTPYDGIVVMLHGKDDEGKDVVMQTAFTKRPWKRAWFQQNIKELQAAKSPRLTDNFVRIGANPGDVDWFDDEGWKQIVDHWRIIAWVARQGGLKGVLFDPEPYAKPKFQFNYSAQSQKERHSFEEYSAKARQRGREVMEAIKSEYPDMTLFTFFMNSVNARSAGQSNPQEALKTASYNLYPAFINGWLDAAPPQMIFVDGCESAYMYSGELPYLRAANAIRNTALSLVAPENHDKYRRQVRAGFSIYLDAYINPETSRYYQKPLDGSRLNRLRDNLKNAAEATDQYIWTWGEKYRWWPTKTSRVNPEYWDEILPGTADALRSVAEPGYWKERAQARFDALEKAGQLVNLVQNGDFASGAVNAKDDPLAKSLDWKTQGAPLGWSTWHKAMGEGDSGHFNWDGAVDHSGKAGSGAARLSGMQSSGVLIQSVPVQSGEYYMIRAWQRVGGAHGSGHIGVRWLNADGKWFAEQQDVAITAPQKPRSGEWQLLSGMAAVPSGAARMVVLLNAANQSTPQDSIWYDDVQVVKIGTPADLMEKF